MSKFLVLIPARYNSSRFPGKPLAKIKDKPMIQYVYENCKEAGIDSFVVTDDERIEKAVKEFGGNVVRVDDEVETGSERIALAYERFFKNYDYIINVQGDEPLLISSEIERIKKFHLNNDFDITTAVKKRRNIEEDFTNKNIVKCVFSEVSNQCLYFSRESIPYGREQKVIDWYQHIGIYSYKAKSLKKFVKLPISTLEATEKLEQLRALENGMTIGAMLTDLNLIGVDDPQDILKIEGVL